MKELTYQQQLIVEKIIKEDAWKEVKHNLGTAPFKGIEHYCENCGAYAIYDKEVEQCYSCDAKKWIRRTPIEYKYMPAKKEE